MNYKIYEIRHISTKTTVYIGLTKGYLSQRFSAHFKDCRRNKKKVNYFRHHKQDLEISLLEDKILTLDNANVREKYWISLYKKNNIRLLNATNGGDGTQGFQSWNKGVACTYVDKIISNHPRLKQVHCYDLNGNYLKSFRSIKVASIETGCSRACIKNICDLKTGYKKSKQYQWRYYKSENIGNPIYNDDIRLQKVALALRCKAKKVICENLLTNELIKFDSLKSASSHFKIKEITLYARIKYNRKVDNLFFYYENH